MARRKIYDANALRDLYLKATTNKYSKATRKAAKQKLIDIAEDQRSEANERLVDLKLEGYNYGQAQDTARNYIKEHYGERALSFHKERKLGDIYEQALQVSAFLGAKESTVEGQKAIERARFEKFREKSPAFEKMNDEKLRDFLRFLGNTSAGEYLNFYDDSGDEREMIVEMWEDENKVEKLNELLADYEKYTEDLDKGVEPSEARGLSASELREELYALYTSKEKRKR